MNFPTYRLHSSRGMGFRCTFTHDERFSGERGHVHGGPLPGSRTPGSMALYRPSVLDDHQKASSDPVLVRPSLKSLGFRRLSHRHVTFWGLETAGESPTDRYFKRNVWRTSSQRLSTESLKDIPFKSYCPPSSPSTSCDDSEGVVCISPQLSCEGLECSPRLLPLSISPHPVMLEGDDESDAGSVIEFDDVPEESIFTKMCNQLAEQQISLLKSHRLPFSGESKKPAAYV